MPSREGTIYGSAWKRRSVNLTSARRLPKGGGVGPSETRRAEGPKLNPERAERGPASGNRWQRGPKPAAETLALGLIRAEEEKTQERQSGACSVKNRVASGRDDTVLGNTLTSRQAHGRIAWFFGATRVDGSGD